MVISSFRSPRWLWWLPLLSVWPAVTCPAAPERHHPWPVPICTAWYTEVLVLCERLAWGRCVSAEWLGIEPALRTLDVLPIAIAPTRHMFIYAYYWQLNELRILFYIFNIMMPVPYAHVHTLSNACARYIFRFG